MDKNIAYLRELLIKSGDDLIKSETHNKFPMALQENLDWSKKGVSNIQTQLGLNTLKQSDTDPTYSLYNPRLFVLQDGLAIKQAIEKIDASLAQISMLLYTAASDSENRILESKLYSLENFNLSTGLSLITNIGLVSLAGGGILLSISKDLETAPFAYYISNSSFLFKGDYTGADLDSFDKDKSHASPVQAADNWGDLIYLYSTGTNFKMAYTYTNNVIKSIPGIWTVSDNLSDGATDLEGSNPVLLARPSDLILAFHDASNNIKVYRSYDLNGDNWDECWDHDSWVDTTKSITPSTTGAASVGMCSGFSYNSSGTKKEKIFIAKPGDAKVEVFENSNTAIARESVGPSDGFAWDDDFTLKTTLNLTTITTATKAILQRGRIKDHFILGVYGNDILELYSSSDGMVTFELIEEVPCKDFSIIQTVTMLSFLVYTSVSDTRNILAKSYYWGPK
jgi:hypothetical protein